MLVMLMVVVLHFLLLVMVTIQYNFIAKRQCSYTRNVLWCQVHSSHIHADHKTLQQQTST